MTFSLRAVAIMDSEGSTGAHAPVQHTGPSAETSLYSSQPALGARWEDRRHAVPRGRSQVASMLPPPPPPRSSRPTNTFGEACALLLRDPSPAKGREFEALLVRILPTIPETEIRRAWTWPDVPAQLRSRLFPQMPRTDTGIDIVAERQDNGIIAIQAKCYKSTARLTLSNVATFLASTSRKDIAQRWVVTTGKWSRNLANSATECAFIHAPSQWGDIPLRRPGEAIAPHELDTLQTQAWRDCVEGLTDHDRGQLVMACGTGKTLVSQRVAEELVPPCGVVVYATPSIGLTAQSRKGWLRNAKRPIRTVVVCSDPQAGSGTAGTGRVSEIEAPVTTDPEQIALAVHRALQAVRHNNGFVALFTTYQSMDKVCKSQEISPDPTPTVDLVIADEAHRTAGTIKGKDAKVFQLVHRALKANKRLYQTATPRIYSQRSVNKIRQSITVESHTKIEVVDMSDSRTYGPELHRLSFTSALDAPEPERRLCDYKVIVLLVDAHDAPESAGTDPIENTAFYTRIAALALAMEGCEVDSHGPEAGQSAAFHSLSSAIAFCNKLKNARLAQKILGDCRLSRWVALRTTEKGNSPASLREVTAGYLSGQSGAAERFNELERLRKATVDGRRHITTNVKVLSEGIDVPALDAICFLEERKSEIDIVQAVGRVMRRPPTGSKQLGYIIVPIVMDPQLDFEETLSSWEQDWRILGQVLRSLRAHDKRIETDLTERIIIRPPRGGGDGGGEPRGFWSRLNAGEFDAIIPAIAEKSGLVRTVDEETNLIKAAVREAARAFLEEPMLGRRLRGPTGIADTSSNDIDKRACAAASLMLTNALLLHQRLNEESFSVPDGTGKETRLTPLSRIKKAPAPERQLLADWKMILRMDYRPIFGPAVEVLQSSQVDGKALGGMRAGLMTLARHCEDIASEYARMGMDHAGKLFQAAMDHPDGDGAYYTLTPGAMLLAELTCDALMDPHDPRWCDAAFWQCHAILDPACGSGTLLMAMLTAIKRRAERNGLDTQGQKALHKALVETSIIGLDVNRRAVQIAAAQLALGVAGTPLHGMELWTLDRGRPSNPDKQRKDEARLGSLEFLATDRHGRFRQPILKGLGSEQDGKSGLEKKWSGSQMEIGPHGEDPRGLRGKLSRTFACVSNPPYSNAAKEAKHLPAVVRRNMQSRKKELRQVVSSDLPELGSILNPNSVRPWFSVLMEELVDPDAGAIGKVMPTTACTSIDGEVERRFWARKFHPEIVITLHHPRDMNWSVKTAITESMIILRRTAGTSPRPPTRFVSLRKQPKRAEDALAIRDDLRNGTGEWGRVCEWPADRVRMGDWSPAVWYDPELARMAARLEDKGEHSSRWMRIGNLSPVFTTKQLVGQKKWEWCDSSEAEVHVLKGAGQGVQQFIAGKIDGFARRVKNHRANELTKHALLKKVGVLHVPNTQGADSGRLTAVCTVESAVGYTWTPIQGVKIQEAKALAVWLNSTLGRIAMRRWGSRKLTWPMYQPRAIKRIVVPNLKEMEGRHVDTLTVAFERTKSSLIPQYKEEHGPARELWDDAVSRAVGIDRAVIADCARRLHREPTIRGKQADW